MWGFYWVMKVAISGMDEELERRWSGKMILPRRLGYPTADFLSNPSQTPLDVQMLLLLLCCTALSLCCSASPRLFCSWSLGFRIFLWLWLQSGVGKGKIWEWKQEFLFPFRPAGFQIWRWGLCWGTTLIYSAFPCFLSISQWQAGIWENGQKSQRLELEPICLCLTSCNSDDTGNRQIVPAPSSVELYTYLVWDL